MKTGFIIRYLFYIYRDKVRILLIPWIILVILQIIVEILYWKYVGRPFRGMQDVIAALDMLFK